MNETQARVKSIHRDLAELERRGELDHEVLLNRISDLIRDNDDVGRVAVSSSGDAMAVQTSSEEIEEFLEVFLERAGTTDIGPVYRYRPDPVFID